MRLRAYERTERGSPPAGRDGFAHAVWIMTKLIPSIFTVLRGLLFCTVPLKLSNGLTEREGSRLQLGAAHQDSHRNCGPSFQSIRSISICDYPRPL